MAKCNKATSPSSKVLAANTLHFKPIFDPRLKENVEGPPSPIRSALVRLGHSLAPVKIWERSNPQGPKYGLPIKLIWVGKH